MKFSIIMPCYNGLSYTVQAVESIIKNVKDFELIIINNGSTDGTGGYVQELENQYSNIRVCKISENKGVPVALNIGMEKASGSYIVWVNNDILVTPDALDHMVDKMDAVEGNSYLTKIGMVGPMMNFVAGTQLQPNCNYQLEQVDAFAEQIHSEQDGDYAHTGWLCGSCVIIKKELVAEVGKLDERFSPGGYEDTDYCLRAQLLGWKLVIDTGTFVHHYGSKTFTLPELQSTQWGTRLFDKFVQKWQDDTPKTLFATYRVKNCAEDLKRSLAATAKFVDGIVVWCDNCTDGTAQIAADCDKVVRIIESDLPFNERRDRQAAIEVTKDYNPDWIVVVDGDEEPEENFTREKMEKLMHPPNPMILAYAFHFRNFWQSAEVFRTDGIIGNMKGPRMFRNLPNQYLSGGTSIGLHCSSIPLIPMENVAWTSLVFKHYGFKSVEACQAKYDFYQNLDDEKDTDLIGQDDYSHLISKEVTVARWQEHNTLSFYCITNENKENLLQILDKVWSSVDELIVINHGGSEEVKEAAELMGAQVIDYQGELDFSKIRNFAKKQCTKKWIFTLDNDEHIDKEMISELRTLIDADCDAWLFDVQNYHKDNTLTYTQAVRLFRNIPELKYEGLVHENFDKAVEKNHLRIFQPPFPIHHYGYLKDGELVREKLLKYRKLNLKQLKRHPNDPKAHFNLALHYINEELYDLASKHLIKAAELDERYYHPRLQMGMLHLQGAQEQFRDVLELIPSIHKMYPRIDQLLTFINNSIGDEPLQI